MEKSKWAILSKVDAPSLSRWPALKRMFGHFANTYFPFALALWPPEADSTDSELFKFLKGITPKGDVIPANVPKASDASARPR